MNIKKKQMITLLVAVLVCLIGTGLLGAAIYIRSSQVPQEQQPQIHQAVVERENKVSLEYRFFWNGDETLFSRENIVVFDVRYVDEDKDILCTLAEILDERFRKKGIQPIFIGAESDSQVRSELLLREDMDLYIGLSTGSDLQDADTFGTKCYYNEEYYLPEYGNVWLCDRLLQNVVTEVSGKALGMEKCGERDLIRALNVPSALLQIGYITNEQEGGLLTEQEYLEYIAVGIIKTVEEYYEGE